MLRALKPTRYWVLDTYRVFDLPSAPWSSSMWCTVVMYEKGGFYLNEKAAKSSKTHQIQGVAVGYIQGVWLTKYTMVKLYVMHCIHVPKMGTLPQIIWLWPQYVSLIQGVGYTQGVWLTKYTMACQALCNTLYSCTKNRQSTSNNMAVTSISTSDTGCWIHTGCLTYQVHHGRALCDALYSYTKKGQPNLNTVAVSSMEDL